MFGLVVLTLLGLVAIIHGAIGIQGARHLFKGFGFAHTRSEVFTVSLLASISFACTMIAWGWGTTLFKGNELGFMVGFGYLFLVPASVFVFTHILSNRFNHRAFHGATAGVGLAIPASTIYYMIYMIHISG